MSAVKRAVKFGRRCPMKSRADLTLRIWQWLDATRRNKEGMPLCFQVNSFAEDAKQSVWARIDSLYHHMSVSTECGSATGFD